MIKDKLTADGKKFKKTMEELEKLQVRIGFQSSDHQYDNGVNVADIAMFNELGTSRSPSRPFMRSSVDDNVETINGYINVVKEQITKGADAKTILNGIGVMQKGLIQEKIVSGDFVPNAEATIRKKGSSKPLIDTGAMRQSVSYVIKPKGDSD